MKRRLILFILGAGGIVITAYALTAIRAIREDEERPWIKRKTGK